MQPNLFFKIDSLIIGFVEKCAHGFQKLTGRTNFFLVGVIAATLLVPTFIAGMRGASPLNPMEPEPLERTGFDYIVLFFLIVSFSQTAIFGWKREENEAWKRLSRGLANPKKNSFASVTFRLILFLMCGLLAPIFLAKGNLVSVAIAILFSLDTYLGSCDPLPPCQGKIKEWLGSLFGKHAVQSG